MEEIKETKCTCIECSKQFEPYLTDVVCHNCNGEGYIEDDDDFMRSGLITCWQCRGHGDLTLTERSFCDDDCREQHFEDQFD
jgi:DnaJ-class molecular chaperone